MNTEYTQKNIEGLLSTFAGRIGMENYDETKPLKIAECNRDFVWDDVLQEKLIKSILEGYPIPAITICNGTIVDGGNRLTTLWLFRNGHLQVKLDDGSIVNYEAMCENRGLVRRWDACYIPQVVVSNATYDQVSQIYQNLNQGKSLTFGQILENRSRRPFVKVGLSMIGYNNDPFELRELVDRVWYKPSAKPKKTKTRGEIAFAYQIIRATEYGPAHFNTNMMEHIDFIMSNNTVPTLSNLKWILETLNEVDPTNSIQRGKKKDCFKRFIGAIIYDLFTSMPKEDIKEKWQALFRKVYNVLSKKQLSKLVDVGVKRANNSLRIEQLSKNVSKYLETGYISGESENSSDTEEESIDTE